MSCDFTADGKYVVSGTMSGVVNGLNIETNKMDMAYNTLEYQPEEINPPITSNMIYSLKTIHGSPLGGNKMLMGCELEYGMHLDVEIWRDEPLQRLEKLGKYVGHTSSVRKIECSKDFKKVLTSSEDHQLIIWDLETSEPQQMLVGHTDVVTGGVYIGDNTIVSSSWDCRILTWNV